METSDDSTMKHVTGDMERFIDGQSLETLPLALPEGKNVYFVIEL